jgi:hypothetical protein
MPSKSKTQQRLMGVAYAVKSGSMQLSDVDTNYKDKVKDLVDGMTLKQLKDFAETKHDGLPEEVEEGISPSNIGGMGPIQLPTDSQPGSGDVPAGRKSEEDEEDEKQIKENMKGLFTTFDQFISEARDFNDPVAMKMRAAQAKRNAKASEPAKKELSPAKAKKLAKLKAERAEIMRDMEQEAEMEGGEVADRYGDMLNKIDKQIAKLTESTINEWGSSDQSIMNQQIHKDTGSPKKMPSPFDRKLRAAAEDAVDWHWDEWPEYKRDREGLIDNAVRSYLRSYFPKDWAIMVRMFEPMESVQVTEAKSIAKIQKEWGNVTSIMKDTVAKYKTAQGQEKEDLLDELKTLTASKKKLEAELDAAVGLKDVDAELAESTVNEMTSDAAIALADEVSGELYTARLKGKSVTINATTTTKTWEDGVPVLKYLARGKAKPVTFSLYQRPFKVVHDVAHNWFYFTDGGKWYGLHGDEGYFEPEDLPFDMEISESLNESIQHGFYYFPKTSVDSSMQPAKGETKYAVICHNTIQMGNNIMYLKSANSNIGQKFEAHVLSVHDSEEEAFKAYQDAVKYDEGKTPSCVSFAYGTLTVKGSNLPFTEIGGERKKLK